MTLSTVQSLSRPNPNSSVTLHTFEAIYQACKNKQWHLLKAAPLKSVSNEEGESILAVFIREGEHELIGEIFQRKLAGALSNNQVERSLHLAAQSGWPKVIVQLLDYLDINGVIDGMTPLHLAIKVGQHNVCATLVNNGAFLSVGNLQFTAVEYAVHQGNVPCLRAILENGKAHLDKNVPQFGTLLHLAIARGGQKMLEYLLSKEKINLELGNFEQKTPLILAATLGDSEAICLLQKAGAHLDAKDASQRTALYWACHKRHTDAVKTLCRLGAHLTPTDYNFLEGAEDFVGKSLYNFLCNLSNNPHLSNLSFHPPRNLAFGDGSQLGTFSALCELQRKDKLIAVTRVCGSGQGVYPATLYSLGYTPSTMFSLWQKGKPDLEMLLTRSTKKVNCTLGELALLITPKSSYKHLHLFATQNGHLHCFSTENKSDHDLVIGTLAKACLTSGQLVAKRNDGTLVTQGEMGAFTKTSHYPIAAFDQHRYLFPNSTSQAVCHNEQTLGFYPCGKDSSLKAHDQMRSLQMTSNDGVSAVQAFFLHTDNLTPFQLPTLSGPEGHIDRCDPPVSYFFGREDQLAILKKTLIDNWTPTKRCLQVLCGLGGVGKSELARQFASEFRKHFALIYQIHSESEAQKEQDFRDLARRLGCKLDENATYAVIRKRVYETLEMSKFEKPYLLIFDNLEKEEELPSYNGSILITSQNSKPYHHTNILSIQPFTFEEATRFVKKMIIDDSDTESIKQLINTLGRFPPALDKACAYIAMEKCTVAEYLNLKILDIPSLLQTGKEKSLETTWQITLKSLDPLAREWLSLCAYLSPQQIPKHWIKAWLKEKREDPNKGRALLRTLHQYHLIQYRGEGPFSINRLLQHFLRKPNAGYQQALHLLTTQLIRLYEQGMDSWETGKIILAHAQALLAHDPESKLRSQVEWLAVRPLRFLQKRMTAGVAKFSLSLAESAIEEVWWSEIPTEYLPLIKPLASLHLSDAIHEKLYRKLSSKVSLEPLRKAYLETLARSLALRLASIPNRDGFRYKQIFAEEALLKSIHTLATTTPSNVILTLPRKGTFYLAPKVIFQLLDSKSNIKRHYRNSLHAVCRLHTSSCDLHFKQEPSHPLMEYAIHSFTSRLMGVTTPPSILARLEVTSKKRVYPVLISQTIEGTNLKATLKKNPIFKPDPITLTWQVLAAILTRPGDARDSNYIVDRKNRLHCVDNDVSFVEPLTKSRFSRTVHFCSILFCLESQPLDKEVIAEFLTLSPETILHGWIKELIEREKAYCSLFSAQERKKLYRSADHFTPSLLFPAGTATNLYLQFLTLQRYLKDHQNKQLMPIDLLRSLTTIKYKSLQEATVGTHLYRYYQNALLRSDPPTVRLKRATSRKQEQSMTTPQVLRATIGHTPTSQEIEQRELFSLEKTEEELLAYSFLRVGNVSIDARKKGQERVRVDFSAIQKENKPDLERQQLMLQGLHLLLSKHQSLLTSIAIRHCDALTPNLLTPFLHANLTYLDLSNSGLTSLPKELDTKCPHLKELYLSGSEELQAFKRGGYFSNPHRFPSLQFLHLARCPKLTEIKLEAPKLHTLKINSNPNLRSLVFDTLFTTILHKDTPRLNIEKWALEVLKKKNLDQISSLHPTLLGFLKRERKCWSVDAKLEAFSILNYFLAPIADRLSNKEPNTSDSLNLEGAFIGDQGVIILAEVLKTNTTLKRLNLKTNNIRERGILALAEALEVNRSLEYLTLWYNPTITEKGALALAAAQKGHPSLKTGCCPPLSTTFAYVKTLEGHKRGVWALAPLSDSHLASGLLDHTIKIWDVDKGICLKTLEGHRYSVYALTLLDNGYFASGSGDHTIKIWDVDKDVCLKTLRGHRDEVYALVLLPNGHLASGSLDHMIKIWDFSKGVCLKTLQGHENTVLAVALLPNSHLASGSKDNTIKIWNVDNSACLKTLKGHKSTVWALVPLPDGHLASGSKDTIKIWDVAKGVCLKTLEGHKGGVWALTLLPDGHLASGSEDQTIKIWDVAKGVCLKTLEGHKGFVYALTLLSNGHLASGSNDKTIKIWGPKR